MSTPNDALDAWRASSEDELLGLEFDLPHVEHDLEDQADLERERYDRQILAALVAPSF